MGMRKSQRNAHEHVLVCFTASLLWIRTLTKQHNKSRKFSALFLGCPPKHNAPEFPNYKISVRNSEVDQPTKVWTDETASGSRIWSRFGVTVRDKCAFSSLHGARLAHTSTMHPRYPWNPFHDFPYHSLTGFSATPLSMRQSALHQPPFTGPAARFHETPLDTFRFHTLHMSTLCSCLLGGFSLACKVQ